MAQTVATRPRPWRWFTGIALGIAAGYAAGIASQSATSLHAEVTELPRREAFLAGGERAEAVLRDIVVILKRMDTRLERLEQLVPAKAASEAKKKHRPEPLSP